MSYQNILVAVDLTDEAKQVLARAAAIAGQDKAKMTIVHVVEALVTETSYDLMPVLSYEVEETLAKRAGQFLEKLKEEAGLDCTTEVLRGASKSEIQHKAEAIGADLVVMGTHGRHGLAMVLGSTANAVLHGTKCDVLAVRVGK
jgi:universal stress protein A